jgi:DNA-binding transcriptional regulator YiaG
MTSSNRPQATSDDIHPTRRLQGLVEKSIETKHLDADDIEFIRLFYNYTRPEFAQLVGCSRQHVHNLEDEGADGTMAVAIGAMAASKRLHGPALDDED